MGTAVDMSAWVELDDIAVRYVVSARDETVELAFGNRPTFTLILSEQALSRCIEKFPEAMAALKAVISTNA
jgi:hypothetical protein